LKELWPKYRALSEPGTVGIGYNFWIFRLNYVANLWKC